MSLKKDEIAHRLHPGEIHRLVNIVFSLFHQLTEIRDTIRNTLIICLFCHITSFFAKCKDTQKNSNRSIDRSGTRAPSPAAKRHFHERCTSVAADLQSDAPCCQDLQSASSSANMMSALRHYSSPMPRARTPSNQKLQTHTFLGIKYAFHDFCVLLQKKRRNNSSTIN